MYQMIDDEARHSICQKSRQCVEILEIQPLIKRSASLLCHSGDAKKVAYLRIGVNVLSLSLEERRLHPIRRDRVLEPDAVGDD